MPWWQAMFIIVAVVGVISWVYTMRVARDVERGEEVDRGVGGSAVKNKLSANPIIWSFIVFLVLIFIVTVYYIFLYPEGAF